MNKKTKNHLKKKWGSNPIEIRHDTQIGVSSAEADDEFLFQCFVDHPALTTLSDKNSCKMFLSGRTGGGKTAVLRKIEKDHETSCSEINLPDMAMDYVANSDVLQFLSALDLDLDLFFQALWKHVLCLDYIRLQYKIQNEETSKSWISEQIERFSKDTRKTSAIQYLQKWEGEFFITVDENIKEVTSRLENTVSAELGGEISKFKTNAGYARTLSDEKRSQVTARAKKFINANLLTDLHKVVDLLSTIEEGNKYNKNFNFILIDGLDEKWVDDTIRYQLIRALIEVLKSFRRIQNVKVIVAIRNDVLERVLQNSHHVGFQREKYEDYFFQIEWTKSQLRQLIEKRIQFLYKRKYTQENVQFEDVFPFQVGKQDPFKYMLERTLMRPRDIISFINIALVKSQGKTEVPGAVIKEAETEYSQKRLQALIEEWESAFPNLSLAFTLITGSKKNFSIGDISSEKFFQDFILELSEQRPATHDPFKEKANKCYETPTATSILDLAKLVFSTLYRTGAIGLKLDSTEKNVFSHYNNPLIEPQQINIETKVRIHPMLYRALRVKD